MQWPAAHLGLAKVHLRKRRNEQAVEQALHAVGLQHFLPQGHFYLGVALVRLGHQERAALAFETSLTMLPGSMAAHRWLATLYHQPGGDPEKAARHNSIYLQMRHRREAKVQVDWAELWSGMPNTSKHLEPRWPAMLALLAVGGLRLSLPESLSAGPDWLLIVIVGVLLIPTAWARQQGKDNLNKFLGYLLSSIVTVDMIWSLGLLVAALPAHRQSPKDLLRSAAALWITNILVFASWYWRLDAGGPRERELRGVHTDGAFLFPQMTLDQQAKREMGEQCWSPGFVDYLFLAFNTSTAFSPTDCPVLSAWAKILMMVQSLISLTTVALLAARAVNIL